MNPYPFALLNHFTVPFKRSTYLIPPFSARPLIGAKGRATLQMPPIRMHFGVQWVGCQAIVCSKKSTKGGMCKRFRCAGLRFTFLLVGFLSFLFLTLRYARRDRTTV